MKLMTFYLSGDRYALDLSMVDAVVGRPEAGSEQSGDVPILDLAHHLGTGERYGAKTPLLILRGGGRAVRVGVERMGEVVEVDEGQVQELPRYFSCPLLRGITELDDGLVVLLDAAELLAAVGGAMPPISAAAQESE